VTGLDSFPLPGPATARRVQLRVSCLVTS